MNIKKKISLGMITTLSIATPIISVTSCKSATSNRDINHSFSYNDDGITHFDNFKSKVKQQWANDMGDRFILTITNKSNKEKVFILEKGEGKGNIYIEQKFMEIEKFLKQ